MTFHRGVGLFSGGGRNSSGDQVNDNAALSENKEAENEILIKLKWN